MVGLYDYMKGTCVCRGCKATLGARLANGVEPAGWPVSVYTLNNVFIGVAYNKEQYIALWNGHPQNAAFGQLSGAMGPFQFTLIYDCNNAAPLYIGQGGYTQPMNKILVETGDRWLLETGDYWLLEG